MVSANIRPIVLSALGALGALGALVLTPATEAQIPDEFTNLQVLPKDSDGETVIGLMRAMTGALGVRCGHCHVGENPERLVGMDFASDDKEPKRVARAMLRMTRKINQDLLPETGRASAREVRCVTCHHGLQQPETLGQNLLGALEEGGVDDLVARYGALRAKYHGEGAYDFGEHTLPALAEQLFGDARADVAVAVLRLNLEHFPASGYSYTMLGELMLRQEQTADAIAAFEQALEIDPSNDRARQRLASVKGSERKPRTPPSDGR